MGGGPPVIFGELALVNARSWESDSSRGLSLLSSVCHSLGISSHSCRLCARGLLCGLSVLGAGDTAVNGRDPVNLCHFSKMRTAVATFWGW